MKNSHTIIIADKDGNNLHIINLHVILPSNDNEYKIVVYPAHVVLYPMTGR